MNKKGFAVSVILYAIIFLIITTLFMLLGVMRTRFKVNNELRENIRESINEEINAGSLFPSDEECRITGNASNYTDNLVLTIDVTLNKEYSNNATNGKLYSWDNETYSINNSIRVNRSGLYTGYFRDNVGGSGSCEIEILSKTQYSYRTCKDSHLLYGDWYKYDPYEGTSEAGKDVYGTSCTEITLEDAENANLDTYIICTSVDSSLCSSTATCYNVKTYKRNVVGCDTEDDAWNNWSDWLNAFPDDIDETNPINEKRNITSYKIKNT